LYPDVGNSLLRPLDENTLFNAGDISWIEARLKLVGDCHDRPRMNALPDCRMLQIRVHARKRCFHVQFLASCGYRCPNASAIFHTANRITEPTSVAEKESFRF
jgi:hypothetical protein